MKVDYNKMAIISNRLRTELSETEGEELNRRFRSLMLYAIDHGHQLPDDNQLDITLLSAEFRRILLLETLGIKQAPDTEEKDVSFDYNKFADFSISVVEERGFKTGRDCEILAKYLMRYAITHDDKLPDNYIKLDSIMLYDVIHAVFSELGITVTNSMIEKDVDGNQIVRFHN